MYLYVQYIRMILLVKVKNELRVMPELPHGTGRLKEEGGAVTMVMCWAG